MNTDLSFLTEAFKTGKRKDAKAVTEQALAENASPQAILDALKTGMVAMMLKGSGFEVIDLGTNVSDAASAVELARSLVEVAA
ncbi:MAG: hypothetical protein WD708_08480 [Kiritimatiellia bacterium]